MWRRRMVLPSTGVLIGTVFVALLSYRTFRNIKHSVTAGEADGFAVGASKQQTYWRAAGLYSGSRVFGLGVSKGTGPATLWSNRTQRTAVAFTDTDLVEAAQFDEWFLHVHDFAGWLYNPNTITLKFRDGKLVSIGRAKQFNPFPF